MHFVLENIKPILFYWSQFNHRFHWLLVHCAMTCPLRISSGVWYCWQMALEVFELVKNLVLVLLVLVLHLPWHWFIKYCKSKQQKVELSNTRSYNHLTFTIPNMSQCLSLVLLISWGKNDPDRTVGSEVWIIDQVVTKWSPSCHQGVTKWSPSGHLVVTQWSPSGHQVVSK